MLVHDASAVSPIKPRGDNGALTAISPGNRAASIIATVSTDDHAAAIVAAERTQGSAVIAGRTRRADRGLEARVARLEPERGRSTANHGWEFTDERGGLPNNESGLNRHRWKRGEELTIAPQSILVSPAISSAAVTPGVTPGVTPAIATTIATARFVLTLAGLWDGVIPGLRSDACAGSLAG